MQKSKNDILPHICGKKNQTLCIFQGRTAGNYLTNIKTHSRKSCLHCKCGRLPIRPRDGFTLKIDCRRINGVQKGLVYIMRYCELQKLSAELRKQAGRQHIYLFKIIC